MLEAGVFGCAPVGKPLRSEVVVCQKRQELLELHSEGAPESREPKRQGRRHHGQSRASHLDVEDEVDDAGGSDGTGEATRDAHERAQAHLPDDLLLVLADVLLYGYLK